MPVGITLLLEYTAVLMVALFAFFVFREKVKARLWIAIALVLAGLAVVAQVWDSSLDPLGVLFALVAAVTLALLLPRRRAAGRRDVAADRRVLDDDVRDRVLGALQRLVGAAPGDLQRPGAASAERSATCSCRSDRAARS